MRSVSKCLAVWLPGALELFFLLGNATVDLLPDGGEFQLGPGGLGLLLLQSHLGFLESRFELLFLLLEATLDLLNLVRAAAALAQLVRQLVDFVCTSNNTPRRFILNFIKKQPLFLLC